MSPRPEVRAAIQLTDDIRRIGALIHANDLRWEIEIVKLDAYSPQLRIVAWSMLVRGYPIIISSDLFIKWARKYKEFFV